MLMTEEEIRFRYRRNGCNKKHIEILAELNDVDSEVIENILYSNNTKELRNLSHSEEK